MAALLNPQARTIAQHLKWAWKTATKLQPRGTMGDIARLHVQGTRQALGGWQEFCLNVRGIEGHCRAAAERLPETLKAIGGRLLAVENAVVLGYGSPCGGRVRAGIFGGGRRLPPPCSTRFPWGVCGRNVSFSTSNYATPPLPLPRDALKGGE